MSRLLQRFSRLDFLIDSRLVRRRLSAYFAAGLAGALAGVFVAGALAVTRSVDPVVAVIAIVAPQVAFLVAVKVATAIAGGERIVLYEQVLAMELATAVALAAAGPVWIGIDLVTIGVGVALVFGRLGCLQVGCCHGRPWPAGIVYGADHVRAGFTRCYQDVPLFPVQLLAAAVHAVIAAVTAYVFLMSAAPGMAAAVYVALYTPARFALELARGDLARRYAFGLSEAQWIGVALAWAVWPWLGPGPGVGLTVAAALVIALRVARGVRGLGVHDPMSMDELARALSAARDGTRADDEPKPVQTASGLIVSYQQRTVNGAPVEHVALSRAQTPLDCGELEVLAERIATILRHPGTYEIVEGRTAGVYHVLVRGIDRAVSERPGR